MRPSADTVGTSIRHFNDFVRGEIRDRNETQEGLASYLNVSRSTLSYRLSGKVEWSLRDFLRTAEYFGMDPRELIRG